MAQFGTILTAPGVQVKIVDSGEKEQSDEKPTPPGGASFPKLPVKFCFA
jgi:hypothetical protein